MFQAISERMTTEFSALGDDWRIYLVSPLYFPGDVDLEEKV